MKVPATLLVAITLLGAGTAPARKVSESVKRTCRGFSAQTARTIFHALRANFDPATEVKKVPDSWLEGLQAHMLLSASRAPHLSE
jgi:hypothetical protein